MRSVFTGSFSIILNFLIRIRKLRVGFIGFGHVGFGLIGLGFIGFLRFGFLIRRTNAFGKRCPICEG